jgi:hypothetical protein
MTWLKAFFEKNTKTLLYFKEESYEIANKW